MRSIIGHGELWSGCADNADGVTARIPKKICIQIQGILKIYKVQGIILYFTGIDRVIFNIISRQSNSREIEVGGGQQGIISR